MHEICIIGDKDSILGFKALGYSTYIVDSIFEAEKVLIDAAERYAIIFIIERYAQELKGTIDRFRESKLPAIIPVPGRGGPTGLSMRTIRDAMERAVGADILFRVE